jgi:hypothetical protein
VVPDATLGKRGLITLTENPGTIEQMVPKTVAGLKKVQKEFVEENKQSGRSPELKLENLIVGLPIIRKQSRKVPTNQVPPSEF